MSRIIKLESENILCLKAISIVPDGSLVKITGPNDSGKTANLKSIWMTLGGKKEIPDDAIRQGQDKGFVQLNIGDNGEVECTARLNLRRRADGTIKADEIILKDAKGRTQGSPMSRLRDMLGFGRGQFDPLAFAGANPEAQVDMLKTALGLDFSELDAEYGDQYEERTIINRQAKELAAKIGEADPDVPAKREDSAALAEEYKQAMAATEYNRQREATIIAAEQSHNASLKRVEELNTQLANATRDSATDWEAIVAAEKVEPRNIPNVEAISERMNNADAINERVRAHELRLENVKELADLKAKSDVFTTNLATIKATRDKMIADADFPINGVVIEGNQILINDHPLANQGSSAQLRFGALLVMKSDPKLRILTMDEALGKLDDESLEMLGVLLDEHNFQGWITGPRTVGEGCIEIRDGEVMAK
jgi:recombinational DNA repair ATPase RecF